MPQNNNYYYDFRQNIQEIAQIITKVQYTFSANAYTAKMLIFYYYNTYP